MWRAWMVAWLPGDVRHATISLYDVGVLWQAFKDDSFTAATGKPGQLKGNSITFRVAGNPPAPSPPATAQVKLCNLGNLLQLAVCALDTLCLSGKAYLSCNLGASGDARLSAEVHEQEIQFILSDFWIRAGILASCGTKGSASSFC